VSRRRLRATAVADTASLTHIFFSPPPPSVCQPPAPETPYMFLLSYLDRYHSAPVPLNVYLGSHYSSLTMHVVVCLWTLQNIRQSRLQWCAANGQQSDASHTRALHPLQAPGGGRQLLENRASPGVRDGVVIPHPCTHIYPYRACRACSPRMHGALLRKQEPAALTCPFT